MIVDKIIYVVSVIIFVTTVVPITVWAFVSTRKKNNENDSAAEKHSSQPVYTDSRRKLAFGIFTIINKQVFQIMKKSLSEATTINYFDLWAGVYSAVRYQLDQYFISETVLNVFSDHVISINKELTFDNVKRYVSSVCEEDCKFFKIFNITTSEMLDDSYYLSLYLNLMFANIKPTSLELFLSCTEAIRNTDNMLHQFL